MDNRRTAPQEDEQTRASRAGKTMEGVAEILSLVAQDLHETAVQIDDYESMDVIRSSVAAAMEHLMGQYERLKITKDSLYTEGHNK